MKITAIVTVIWLGAFGGTAAAAEPASAALPDPAYCSQRDADAEKCVIQNGPPARRIVRRKSPSPQQPPASSHSAAKS